MAMMMVMPQQMMADIEINEFTFPDENFRSWVWSRYGKDGVLTEEEIAKTTTVDVHGKNISNLSGIEYFTALTDLKCWNNQLTSLNVSNNTILTNLSCMANQLTSLDVSGCTALTVLWCANNQLTSLDVSSNTALTDLSCSINQLTSLDVSNNTALTILRCDENQLTFLDVSNNIALTDLVCSDNQLTFLDVSKNTALEFLNCSGCQLTSLDVSKNTALTDLYCEENQVTSLIVKGCTALTLLHCYGNLLTELYMSSCSALTELDCYDNLLTVLEVSDCTALSGFSCSNNQLTSLDVSKNVALTGFNCSANQLTSLNVSNNTALTEFYCYDNQLSGLNVSNNTALTRLACYSNRIKGAEMDALIAGLPGTGGYLYAIALNDRDEQNVVTKIQVANAKEKGWNTRDSQRREYEGSEPETIEITPMEEGESVVFVNVLDEGSSIYDIAVGNIYYCISSDDGSYDPAEGCIVVTKVIDDSAIDGKDIFGEDFKDGYTGIVFKVPSGEGTVKVDAATTGSMTLKVKIGSNEPIARTVEGRQTLSFPYSVSEDTYIYIYGGMNAAGARGMRKAAGEDALKIYGIEVASGTDGIDNVQSSKFCAQSPVYTLSGQRIISSPSGRPGGVPTKGIYIQNGRKVLVK